MSKLPLVVTGMMMVSAALPAGAAPHPFRVGEPFPDRVLPRLADGTPGSLADFRGEKVVLHVFASW